MGVPPGSPNPNPISDKKKVIFHTHPFSDPVFKIIGNYIIIRLQQQQKGFRQIDFE